MPAVADPAIHEERQTAIKQIIGLQSVLALQRICRPAVRGYREVGHTDVEEVSALELQIAKIQRAVAPIVEHRNFDRVRASRKYLLGGELALRVDRNRTASHPYFVVRGHTAALHLDRTATERNVVTHQLVLPVCG